MNAIFSKFHTGIARTVGKFSPTLFHGNQRNSLTRFCLKRLIVSGTSGLKHGTKLLVPALPAVFSIATVAMCKAGSLTDSDVIKQADELYASNEVDKLYELLLQSADSVNADILWRLARATCDKAKSSPDAEQKKKLMYEALDAAERALAAGRDTNFACHKWYAIMLDYIGEYQGTKERISRAYDIKEHFEKAIQLNPKDATSIHLIGYWCFVFADLPWYQKKIAAVLFATPPSSTYDEALSYFLKAEKTDPNFYTMNLLMLGKTYAKLGDKEQAKKYIQTALEYPVRTEDDKRANKEASELLKTL